MTFVSSQLADTYNYSYSITNDHYGNIYPIPSMKNQNRTETKSCVYRTRTEHEPNFLKHSETEPNPCHQRTRTEHELEIWGSLPSLVATTKRSNRNPNPTLTVTLADETQGVHAKLRYPLTMRARRERLKRHFTYRCYTN